MNNFNTADLCDEHNLLIAKPIFQTYGANTHCSGKIKTVEAGAQGHHKIQRGYIAKPTYSNHFVLNDSFAKAIKNFTKLEEIEINKQIKFINTKNSPYSNI